MGRCGGRLGRRDGGPLTPRESVDKAQSGAAGVLVVSNRHAIPHGRTRHSLKPRVLIGSGRRIGRLRGFGGEPVTPGKRFDHAPRVAAAVLVAPNCHARSVRRARHRIDRGVRNRRGVGWQRSLGGRPRAAREGVQQTALVPARVFVVTNSDTRHCRGACLVPEIGLRVRPLGVRAARGGRLQGRPTGSRRRGRCRSGRHHAGDGTGAESQRAVEGDHRSPPHLGQWRASRDARGSRCWLRPSRHEHLRVHRLSSECSIYKGKRLGATSFIQLCRFSSGPAPIGAGAIAIGAAEQALVRFGWTSLTDRPAAGCASRTADEGPALAER